jgi:hypothetical protein
MVGKITGNQLSSTIIISGSFSGSFVGDGSGLSGTGGGGSTPTLQQVTNAGASTTTAITASIISASGNIIANHITASGNMSASGDIFANTGSLRHITNIDEIRKDADTFIRFEDSKIILNSFGTTANSILEIGSLAGEESFVAKADTIKFQSYGANPIINISQGTNSTRFYLDITGSGALLVTSNEINFTNLPTSDPGIAGRLYRDGSGNVKISI